MFLNPEPSWPYLVTLQPCSVNILNCCQHLTGKKNSFFHKHVFVYYWTCPSRTCSNHCPDPDPVLSFLHPSFGEIHSLVFGITQINNNINPSLNETFQTVWILWLLPVWLETDFTHKNTTRWLKCCADKKIFSSGNKQQQQQHEYSHSNIYEAGCCFVLHRTYIHIDSHITHIC